MNAKSRVLSLVTYFVISVGLILLFDRLWPDNRIWTTVIPLVVAGLITHFIRKLYDFIFDYFNWNKVEPYLGVSVAFSHSSRNFAGYGASCGEVIHAGNFKANYEVEVELVVTIQNESPDTIYQLEIDFEPSSELSNFNYSLVDSRENKLQPLEINKSFDFRLRLKNVFYDVYSHEADKEIQKIYRSLKDKRLVNGSKVNIRFKDSMHKAHTKTEVIL